MYYANVHVDRIINVVVTRGGNTWFLNIAVTAT